MGPLFLESYFEGMNIKFTYNFLIICLKALQICSKERHRDFTLCRGPAVKVLAEMLCC